MEPEAIVWTEGKTDWQHLKRAFQALGVGTGIAFKELDGDFGDDRLFKQCSAFALEEQTRPTIFIFDRDKDDIVRKVEDPAQSYKSWGNNVYSFAIPIPSHRRDQSTTCIEFYYSDDELRTPDEQGRRLFVSSEFNPISGRHLTDSRLSIGNKERLPKDAARARIVDSEVFDERNQNVALSKADFANRVQSAGGAFGRFGFEPFHPVVSIINTIVNAARPMIDLPFGGFGEFSQSLEGLGNPKKFSAIVNASIRAAKLGVMIFIAATLREYEQRIVDASSAEAKKVRPIKQILAQSFGHPSLTTLQKLARHCYHLVDAQAPSEVHSLRAMLGANPKLGPVGDLLDDLEQVFGAPRVRTVNKSQLKKPLLEYVIPELARYEAKLPDMTELSSADFLETADWNRWSAALSNILGYFAPLCSLTFRVKIIERLSDSDQFDVLLTTYRDGRVSVENITQTYKDLDDNRFETYELLVDGGNASLDLFPFIGIKADKLNCYGRTKASGFEYRVVFGTTDFSERTKRKFAHVALRTTIATDLQSLFWTQVMPSTSALGVKANIPAQDEIVGRKQQIATIMEEIIQIPNQNGIIYGPGGVGKTALLIELSRQLWEESPSQTPPFKNIIWVSAKPNYYDPTLDEVAAKLPQFRSLDTVLTAILEFLEFEDAATYTMEEKKWLVLESLAEEKTLLILDNFESIADTGQREILKFFGVSAKQSLRNKPDYFKVLVTSRKLVPSGFHQINLTGLDDKESKQLMQRLYQPYARSGKAQRTDEEFDSIHDATRGIPLIIKHCYGQIYEYNVELNSVLKRLSQAGSKVVDFSFTEVFDHLKEDELQLRTILLLELSARRLMVRQIADILAADEAEVSTRLAQLINFQCASVVSSGTEEKYGINDQVRFLSRRLTLEYAAVATEIRQQIANLAMDKRLDYTQKEYDAVLAFEDYISQGHYVLAENLMNERLKEHPGSLLLNLHYARYLKEIKRRTEDAIARLEEILARSGYDQQVLRLLMAYYVALEIPNYEQAHTYARELEDVAASNKEIKSELAQFYVAWSTATKLKVELDPLKEKVRQQRFKEHADTAIKLLKEIDLGTHEWHYLLAQSYFNRGDNESALRHVDKAMAAIPNESYLWDPYRQLRYEILKKQKQAEERGERQSDKGRRVRAGRPS